MAEFLKKLLGGSSTEPMLLVPGSPAPDFSVLAHDGSTVTLRGLRGKKILLWFYPKADTPGCTIEGKELCSTHSRFAERGVVVLGVSFDGAAANKAFAEKFAFPYLLLCDTDRKLGVSYGACDKPGAGHARRISYVIDENGIIAHALLKVDPSTHAAEVLSLIG